MTEVACPRDACKGRCLPVAKAGKTYRCAAALAAAYNVKVGAVYQALSKTGSTDRIGKPSGRPGHFKKVQFGPHKWPSIAAMARDLGVERSGLGKRLKRDRESVLADVIRWSERT